VNRWHISLALLCLAACEADTRPLSYDAVTFDGTPVPRANFCPLLARAYCEAIEGCACAASEDCRAQLQDDCAGPTGFLSPRVQQAIEDGQVVYDEVAAGRVLEATAMGTPDCSFFEFVGWRARDLLSFGGVLSGQIEAREPCSLDWQIESTNDCADSVCAARGDGSLRCTAVRAPGAVCNEDDLCGDLDAEVRAPSDGSELVEYLSRCDAGRCGAPAPERAPSVCLGD